jgi:hypothetical protein
MKVEIRPLAVLRRSADWSRWRELARDAPPFLLPEFFALTAPLTQGEPLVATASRSDRLLGALPLLERGHQLRNHASEQTPGYDYWGAPEGLEAIWTALRSRGGWRELLLEGIPAGSLLATRLPALARAGLCPAVLRPAYRQRFFALPGFEARLDSRFRMGLRRCERKAGGLELERIARPTRADFQEALAIEAMAWKGAAATSLASDRHAAHLYGALGRLLGPRGRAHICFLRAGARRIAVALTVEDGHTLYPLKVGYDPLQAALGPGHLIIWKLAADAEQRGLRELNFLGRDQEWKRKWTDHAHELVSLRIYGRSASGLTLYALREQVKPRLPESMRDLRTPLRRGCQRDDIIGAHSWADRIRGRIGDGLGIKSGLLRAIGPRPPPREPLGEASRFAPGDWVRVLDAPAIRATLDAGSRLRGLKFIPQQWASCGRVHRVTKRVRRMRDDHGRYRPVGRTVLLEAVDCGGEGPGPAGCGRHCPTMYRDDWLEPAPRPRLVPPGSTTRRHARVRGVDEIVAGLDLDGRRDGLEFMPEMAQLAGRRFAIAEALRLVYEYDRWVETPRPFYILEGVHCSGSVPGEPGPCDRSCALLWHEDWLLLDPREGQGAA